jgi:hypothetical protein
MRRLNLLTRDDLRFLRASFRCQRLEIKWSRSNASRREVIGNDVLAELSGLLGSHCGEATPHIAEPEGRLVLQHTIGMLQSRVALDLGRREEAMTYATEFNGCFQLLLNLAEEEGWFATKQKTIQELIQINKECYDAVMTSSREG